MYKINLNQQFDSWNLQVIEFSILLEQIHWEEVEENQHYIEFEFN